jgi:hypothetical protein
MENELFEEMSYSLSYIVGTVGLNQIAMLSESVFCIMSAETVTAVRKPSGHSFPGRSMFLYLERYLASQEHQSLLFPVPFTIYRTVSVVRGPRFCSRRYQIF